MSGFSGQCWSVIVHLVPSQSKIQNPKSKIAVAVLTIVIAFAGCGLSGRSRQSVSDAAPKPQTGSLSRRAASKIIREAIKAYGGRQAWMAREGIELETAWKSYEGGRVSEDPARVQILPGNPTRIRIHYTKLDQVFGFGDQGAWVTMHGQSDKNEQFVARARFTAKMLAFFLVLPFNLTEPDVVVHGGETLQWGGEMFDAVTIGFRSGGEWPWPGDSMTLWFRRPTHMLDRCFFVSTAGGTAFDQPGKSPPNYVWIRWENLVPLDGVPTPRLWSFFRAEASGAMQDKLYDVEVTSAQGRLSFMPILFREPVIEPRVQRLPVVEGETGAGKVTKP